MAAEIAKKRRMNYTPKELNVLITTVLRNYELLFGSSREKYPKEVRDQVWAIVVDEVNSVSKTIRSVNDIQKKWHNYRFSSNLSSMDPVEMELKEIDSMPLQQRLSRTVTKQAPLASESGLQSQPLSPTKLKVTRQGKSPPPLNMLPTGPSTRSLVCLKWDSHYNNIQSAFPTLLTKGQYVDCTLVAEGKSLKCHRMILSSCSPYFEDILSDINPLQHPVIFMKDIPFWILKALCDFMYAGEVHIMHANLQELLDVADNLKIKGLSSSIPDPESAATKDSTEVKQETEGLRGRKKDDKKTKDATSIVKDKVQSELPGPSSRTPLSTRMIVSKINPVSFPNRGGSTPSSLSKVYGSVKPTHGSRQAEVLKEGKPQNLNDKAGVVLRMDHINDPLDLLQPIYEEIEEVKRPPIARPAHLIEGNTSVKRGINRRVRKRRFAEIETEREGSPPLVFHSRKGTRSRPNVKVPKYFQHNESKKKSPSTSTPTDPTIVREPHTSQSDPLFGMVHIKTEPVDVTENILEENVTNYVAPEQEGEEIIGSFDSSLMNMLKEPKKAGPRPVITDVHTVADGDNVGVINLKGAKLKIVDITKISGQLGPFNMSSRRLSAPEKSKTANIVISNVQSMAELPDEDKANVVDPLSENNEQAEVVGDQSKDKDPLAPSVASVTDTDTEEGGLTCSSIDSLPEENPSKKQAIESCGSLSARIESFNIQTEPMETGSLSSLKSVKLDEMNSSKTLLKNNSIGGIEGQTESEGTLSIMSVESINESIASIAQQDVEMATSDVSASNNFTAEVMTTNANGENREIEKRSENTDKSCEDQQMKDLEAGDMDIVMTSAQAEAAGGQTGVTLDAIAKDLNDSLNN